MMMMMMTTELKIDVRLSKKSCKCSHYYQVTQITLIVIKYSETYLVDEPGLTRLIQEFIHNQYYPYLSMHDFSHLPPFYKKIYIYCHYIPCPMWPVWHWWHGAVNIWSWVPWSWGFQSTSFLSFTHNGEKYPCALVHWFSHVGDMPSDWDVYCWARSSSYITPLC